MQQAHKVHGKDHSAEKVGSDRRAAQHFADSSDFGVPARDAGRLPGTAEEAKYQPQGDHISDPRAPRSGSGGTRESGVGGRDSGAGSSSGGDVDTDILGVGTDGLSLASGGPDERSTGADMTQAGTPQHIAHPHNPTELIRGSTVNRSGGDVSTTGSGMGAGGLTDADPGDDAAAGEISQGEAAGDDNTDSDNA
jgi:hypothetical protein